MNILIALLVLARPPGPFYRGTPKVDEAMKQQGAAPAGGFVIHGNGAVLYEKPGRGKATPLADGTPVQFAGGAGMNPNWAKVLVGDQKGYIEVRFLVAGGAPPDDASTAAPPSFEPAPTSSGGGGWPSKGATLYVKGSGVNLWDKPNATGKKFPLKAGDAVSWQGADQRFPEMNAVEVGKRRGFVRTSDLSPVQPVSEDYPTGREGFPESGSARAGGSLPIGTPGPAADAARATLMLLSGSTEAQRGAGVK